jgi:hypothetical protein
MRVHRRNLPIIAATAAAVLTGCAGPREPLDVGTQAVPLSLVLERHQAVASAPVGPLTLPRNPPPGSSFPLPGVGGAATQVPTLGPLPPLPSFACPPFSPIAPVLAATSDVQAAPEPAALPYRGLIVSIAGTSKPVAFVGDSTWTSSKPVANPLGDLSFDVRVTGKGLTSSRSYTVVKGDGPPTADPTRQAELPPRPAAPREPGLFMTKFVDADGRVFQPVVPLPLLLFPAQPGQTFRAESSDANTTMSYVATVKGRGKTNACGVPVEGWQVELTEGKIRVTKPDGGVQGESTTFLADFTEKLLIGTQFGGTILEDEVKVSNNINPVLPVIRNEHFTISKVPVLPKAPA